MIEQIVELFRNADESAWVEPESGGYVCIDGHFDVAIIESWLAEVIRKAKNDAWFEGFSAGWDECDDPDGFVNDKWDAKTPSPYRQGEE